MSSNSTAIGGSRDILTSSHGFCSALLGDRTIEELFAEAPGRRYGKRESGDVFEKAPRSAVREELFPRATVLAQLAT